MKYIRNVYILHVPSRDTVGTFWDRKRLVREAEWRHFNPYVEPNGPCALDAALGRNTMETIIEEIHEMPFRSFSEVWIIGTGSSAFARQVIEQAREYRIPIRNQGAGRMLGAMIQWTSAYERARAAKRAKIMRAVVTPERIGLRVC